MRVQQKLLYRRLYFYWWMKTLLQQDLLSESNEFPEEVAIFKAVFLLINWFSYNKACRVGVMCDQKKLQYRRLYSYLWMKVIDKNTLRKGSMNGLSEIRMDVFAIMNVFVSNNENLYSSKWNFWGERQVIRFNRRLFKLCLAKYLENLNVVNREISEFQR